MGKVSKEAQESGSVSQNPATEFFSSNAFKQERLSCGVDRST